MTKKKPPAAPAGKRADLNRMARTLDLHNPYGWSRRCPSCDVDGPCPTALGIMRQVLIRAAAREDAEQHGMTVPSRWMATSDTEPEPVGFQLAKAYLDRARTAEAALAQVLGELKLPADDATAATTVPGVKVVLTRPTQADSPGIEALRQARPL